MTDASQPPQRFVAMEIRDADERCGKPRRLHHRTCPACKSRVAIHCDECLIQVSGCLCTMVERHGQDGAVGILKEQFGDDDHGARERLRQAGLWTPH